MSDVTPAQRDAPQQQAGPVTVWRLGEININIVYLTDSQGNLIYDSSGNPIALAQTG